MGSMPKWNSPNSTMNIIHFLSNIFNKVIVFQSRLHVIKSYEDILLYLMMLKVHSCFVSFNSVFCKNNNLTYFRSTPMKNHFYGSSHLGFGIKAKTKKLVEHMLIICIQVALMSIFNSGLIQ